MKIGRYQLTLRDKPVFYSNYPLQLLRFFGVWIGKELRFDKEDEHPQYSINSVVIYNGQTYRYIEASRTYMKCEVEMTKDFWMGK